MRILVIDNFDSFTFNLVQYLGTLGGDVEVYRNDAITPDQILKIGPDRVLISPGPGRPEDAGVSKEVIAKVAGKIPILGVCLGHQCIGEVFGGRVIRTKPFHGKVTPVNHDGKGLFRGIPNPMKVARYHSLAVNPGNLDDEIVITARTEEGIVMGMRHERLGIEGIQFHPESFMTPMGMEMMANFLRE